MADTLEAIIIAENAVRDRQRELKRIINDAGPRHGDRRRSSSPPPSPTVLYYRLDPDQLADAALAGRMEMLELELPIAARRRPTSTSPATQTLPLVTLDYTYNINGLGASFGRLVRR